MQTYETTRYLDNEKLWLAHH